MTKAPWRALVIECPILMKNVTLSVNRMEMRVKRGHNPLDDSVILEVTCECGQEHELN